MVNKINPLPQEQRDLLNDLIENNKDALQVLGYMLEQAVKHAEEHVNSVNVSSSAAERDLVYRRLKAEGARKLFVDYLKICRIS